MPLHANLLFYQNATHDASSSLRGLHRVFEAVGGGYDGVISDFGDMNEADLNLFADYRFSRYGYDRPLR